MDFFSKRAAPQHPVRVFFDFRVIPGGPNLDFTRHGQCFVMVGPFSSEPEKAPKRTSLGGLGDTLGGLGDALGALGDALEDLGDA